MFPSVWSSLLMVNKQALGTLVSLLMVILERNRTNRWANGGSPPSPSLNPALQRRPRSHLLLEDFLHLFFHKDLSDSEQQSGYALILRDPHLLWIAPWHQ